MSAEKHNAIEKAIYILKLFAPANQEMGTAEISRMLGYHKATVSRTLLLLTRHGLLEQNPNTRKFRLGPAVLSLGMALSRSMKTELVHIAKPYIDALRDRFQESAILAVLSTKHASVAHISEGPKRIRLAWEIGDILPVHVTAGAKAIVAFASPEVRKNLLDQEFERLTPKTITDPKALMRHLDEIKQQGVAFNIGEHDIDTSAIGAPILDIEGKPVAAVVIAGFSSHIDVYKDSEMVKAVKGTARMISKQLYYPG